MPADHTAHAHAPTIHAFTLGPFETNCYIVAPPATPPTTQASHPRPCWIIDASFAPAPLLRHLQHHHLAPEALILTHAHADHIAGIPDVKRAFPALPVWIHEAEADWLEDPERNLSAQFGVPISLPPPDRLLRAGDTLHLGALSWRVIHTPGHSPGGIALFHEPSATSLVGDTLFASSIGRTDLPGGDMDTLAHSIRTRLYTLPDATRVLPGHGPETTIAKEKRSNPYVRA
jgi:glyoxylase-like metal-dependent hydrolase (beta-lactamase superfamily II)